MYRTLPTPRDSEGISVVPAPRLVPRPVYESVAEMLDGCNARGAPQPFRPADARSGSHFERVVVNGQPCVVKHVHLDDDFTMRVSGDLGCRPLRVWEAGMMDVAADVVDHAVLAAARNDGRNGWGAALLMRDATSELVPVGDDPLPESQHLGFLDHLAVMSARWWGWRDDLGLLAPVDRWRFFGPEALLGERQLGWPEAVPRIAADGWGRFRERVPVEVAALIDGIHAAPWSFVDAMAETPWTFLHGDWKFGNLGTAADGRTVLLDWPYPGAGPVVHELAWYLALNRARLPLGHTKESTIADFRVALARHGVDIGGWWDRQLALGLLGGLVQFGWEKALGDDDELAWWCDAGRAGAVWL